MDNEKITISMDEVNRADPVPGSSPSDPFSTPPEPLPPKRNRSGLFIGIGIAVGLVLCGIIVAAAIKSQDKIVDDEPKVVEKPRVRTIDDVRAELKSSLEQELSSPSSSLGQQLKQRIEKAHITVNVTSTKVVRVDVATIDGSNLAGADDDNVKSFSALIRFNWQGIIDSGYTDLLIAYDAVNDRWDSKIDYSTTPINIEDKQFWWDVGALIGTALAL